MKNLLCIFSLLLFLTACDDKTTENTTATTSTENTAANSPKVLDGTRPIVGKKYTLVPFFSSVEYQDPKLELYDYRNEFFTFQPNGMPLSQATKDYQETLLRNDSRGQHILLWLDNDAPQKIYNPLFKYGTLADGKYYMVGAFGKSYGETIKTPETTVARRLIVKNGGVVAHSKIKPQMILYNEPSGVYKGEDAKRVLLDFFLVNCTLDASYKVLVDINGEEQFYLNKWQAFWIEGLPMGENEIKLTLLYTSGELVDAPQNPVMGKFTLEE